MHARCLRQMMSNCFSSVDHGFPVPVDFAVIAGASSVTFVHVLERICDTTT